MRLSSASHKSNTMVAPTPIMMISIAISLVDGHTVEVEVNFKSRDF
jgi:hypothetical protein